MDPITMYLMLATAGASLGGSALQAKAQGDANQQSAAQTQAGRGDLMAQSVANFLQGQQQQKMSQANEGLLSTQMDPYKQARALGRAQLASQINPNGVGFSSLSTAAMSPDSLANAKTQFDKYAAAAQPNVPISGDSDAETFRTDYNKQQDDLSNQIMAYLRNIGVYTPSNAASFYPYGYQGVVAPVPGAPGVGMGPGGQRKPPLQGTAPFTGAPNSAVPRRG